MKKRLIILMLALFTAVGCSFAQIIYTDEDPSHIRAESSGNFGVMVPMQGVSMDQWKFTPLGNGMLLLAGLGVGYLFRKRKEN